MDAGTSSVRQTRARHRHDLRTLTYVTLDQANGGVVRNVTREGIGVQLVTTVRPRQQLQVRFELRYPRLRVETRGEVVWSTFSGQCGIRFLDLPPRMRHQIDEWILGNLLEGIYVHSESESIFAPGMLGPELVEREESNKGDSTSEPDGLMVSPTPVKVIELPAPARPVDEVHAYPAAVSSAAPAELDWLSQPLSGRSLAWTINGLVVFAGVLLFALIFLLVIRETPRWPWAMAAGDAVLIAALYWALFEFLGEASVGARLARLAGGDHEDQPEGTRFR